MGASSGISGAACGRVLKCSRVSDVGRCGPCVCIVNTSGSDFFSVVPIRLISNGCPGATGRVVVPSRTLSGKNTDCGIKSAVALRVKRHLLSNFSVKRGGPTCVASPGANRSILGSRVVSMGAAHACAIINVCREPGFRGHATPNCATVAITSGRLSSATGFSICFGVGSPSSVCTFVRRLGLNNSCGGSILAFVNVFQFNDFANILMDLTAIMVLLVVFNSISLVCGTFTVSMSREAGRFNLLSSVKTAGGRLGGVILFRTLSIDTVNVPLKVLMNVNNVKVALLLVNDGFASMFNNCSRPVEVYIS